MPVPTAPMRPPRKMPGPTPSLQAPMCQPMARDDGHDAEGGGVEPRGAEAVLVGNGPQKRPAEGAQAPGHGQPYRGGHAGQCRGSDHGGATQNRTADGQGMFRTASMKPCFWVAGASAGFSPPL